MSYCLMGTELLFRMIKKKKKSFGNRELGWLHVNVVNVQILLNCNTKWLK